MYRVIAYEYIFERIDHYGDLFFRVFLSRFSDTGMGEAEGLIQRQYLEASDLLVDSIIDKMLSILSDFVYFTPLGNGQRETSFRLGNRRIFLTYTEDEVTMTRCITDIEILRK